MHTVLGLSLNSDDVAWVVVDADNGTILDHDALEFQPDSEIAGAAARGAHAIARACGYEVDRVRLTWSDDVGRDGLRLRTRLKCLGFDDVEAVPLARVLAVSVDPGATDLAPRIALAYGAALAILRPSAAITVPAVPQIPTLNRRPHRRLGSAVLGVAAAAVLSVFCLSAGAAPQDAPGTTTADEPAPADTGWVAVTAPSAATEPVRKVVDTPSYTEPTRTSTSVQTDIPAQTDVPAQTDIPAQTDVAAAPGPIAETPPVVAEVPHLSVIPHVAGPAPGPADPVSVPTVPPDMTESADVFTALP